MIRLEDVLYENGDELETARFLSRKYGADPLNVLVTIEDKATVKRNLEVLLKELNPVQKQILLMTGLGYTTRAIAVELNREHSTIVGCRRTIGKKLFAVADEDRISRLKSQLETWRGKKKEGRRYRKVVEEYRRRYAVREALKNLYSTLTPAENLSSRKQYSSRPTLLFERLSNVGRENQCRLRQYLQQSFGDDNTVCTLCRKCAGK